MALSDKETDAPEIGAAAGLVIEALAAASKPGAPRSWICASPPRGRGPATHRSSGGTRNPMVVRRPARIADTGRAALALHPRHRDFTAHNGSLYRAADESPRQFRPCSGSMTGSSVSSPPLRPAPAVENVAGWVLISAADDASEAEVACATADGLALTRRRSITQAIGRGAQVGAAFHHVSVVSPEMDGAGLAGHSRRRGRRLAGAVAVVVRPRRCGPLPDVSDHVDQTPVIGGESTHRRRAILAGRLSVCHGKSPCQVLAIGRPRGMNSSPQA